MRAEPRRRGVVRPDDDLRQPRRARRQQQKRRGGERRLGVAVGDPLDLLARRQALQRPLRQSARQRRGGCIGAAAQSADAERAIAHEASRIDGIAGDLVGGAARARQHVLVDRRPPLQHHAVRRQILARPDDDHSVAQNLVEADDPLAGPGIAQPRRGDSAALLGEQAALAAGGEAVGEARPCLAEGRHETGGEGQPRP